MKNDRYQKIERDVRILFTLFAFFAFLPSACKGKEEALPEELENLGRATGPVSSKAQLAPQEGGHIQKNQILQGVVKETIPVSRYTYVLLVDKSGREVWAAVPQIELSQGQAVRIKQSLVMRDFKSPGLGRTFSVIVFGTLEGSEEADAGAPLAPMSDQKLPPGHPPITQ